MLILIIVALCFLYKNAAVSAGPGYEKEKKSPFGCALRRPVSVDNFLSQCCRSEWGRWEEDERVGKSRVRNWAAAFASLG